MGRFGLTLHPDKTRLLPFRRPPKRAAERQRSGHLRLPRVHALLGASPQRTLGDVVQDTACEPADGPSSPSTTGVDAIGISRSRSSTQRSRGASRATSTTSASAATSAVCCCWSKQAKRTWYKWLCRRSQRKRLTWERFADLLRRFPLPRPGSRSGSGARSHEPHPRRSRMVEISLSGSGEGPGWVTAPGYSTSPFPKRPSGPTLTPRPTRSHPAPKAGHAVKGRLHPRRTRCRPSRFRRKPGGSRCRRCFQ